MRLKLLTVFTSVLILLSHFAGAFLNLYVLFPDYDMFMHFLGGMWVASSIVFFIKYTLKSGILDGNFFANILIVCSATALAAVLWEFFEFYVNILGSSAPNTYTDTLSDLFFGVSGAIFASIVVFTNRQSRT